MQRPRRPTEEHEPASERTTKKSFVAVDLLANEESERARDPRRRSFVARLRAHESGEAPTAPVRLAVGDGDEARPDSASAPRRPQFTVSEDPRFYADGRSRFRRKAVVLAIVAAVLAAAAPLAVRACRGVTAGSAGAPEAPGAAPRFRTSAAAP
jgi:hypothetical protein